MDKTWKGIPLFYSYFWIWDTSKYFNILCFLLMNTTSRTVSTINTWSSEFSKIACFVWPAHDFCISGSSLVFDVLTVHLVTDIQSAHETCVIYEAFDYMVGAFISDRRLKVQDFVTTHLFVFKTRGFCFVILTRADGYLKFIESGWKVPTISICIYTHVNRKDRI